jgi:RNA polymerase sigma factor (TIGR02999 family)
MFNSPLQAFPRSLRPVRLHGVGTARLAEAEAARKEAHRIAVQGGRRIRSSGTSGVPHKDDVTGLLVAWGQGDRAADSRLIAVVYQDLRRVARRRLRAERADHSLAPTALVHEAYLRLVDLRRLRWQNRAQFFAIAARLMRQILVDHARAHVAAKRGGPRWKVPLADDLAGTMPRDVDLLDLDAALGKLATIDSRLGDLVVLRFFGGLTVEEAAEGLGMSPATVKRDWSRARAWLFRELRKVVQ